jgi:hypothetical protein
MMREREREREREYEKYERDNVVMMCAHERERAEWAIIIWIDVNSTNLEKVGQEIGSTIRSECCRDGLGKSGGRCSKGHVCFCCLCERRRTIKSK